MRPSLEVCLSPQLIELYELQGKIVVVVDILRATSCMVTALANGVKDITPVASVEECRALQAQGYLAAAERNGAHVEGFDLGNSPLSYIDNDFSGRRLAMTTSNGTLAITKAQTAEEVIIGAFLNISRVAQYLQKSEKDVLILCSGWKGKVSHEDSLFAGALAAELLNTHDADCDSTEICLHLYHSLKGDLLSAIKLSSHYRRLVKLDISRDFEWCASPDKYDTIPHLRNGVLVNM